MPSRYFAFVPAAGSGSRLGADGPKQYLPIGGRPLLSYALGALAACRVIERIHVVLAPGDTLWATLPSPGPDGLIVPLWCGGATRGASVYNGLVAMRDTVDPEDWILVHDAARPCLDPADVERLIAAVGDDGVGGLLAVPLADTLKRDDGAGRIARTEPRDRLWCAQTPQMFRYHLLVRALHDAGPDTITDEASAVERAGHAPLLVAPASANPKVTWPADLAVAEAVLAARVRGPA